MTARSLSPATEHDLAMAEERLRRKQRERGRTFATVEAALGWYFEARLRMQSAHGLHPRGTKVGDEIVIVEVDGGEGGDLDDTMATLVTIEQAVRKLREHNPRAYTVLELAELGDPTVPDIDSAAMKRVEQLVSERLELAAREGRKVNEEKATAAALEAVAANSGCPVEQMRGWWKRYNERRPSALTMRQIGEKTGESAATVSHLHWRAISFLQGWLGASGVLR